MAESKQTEETVLDAARRGVEGMTRLLIPLAEAYGRSKEAEAACEAARDPSGQTPCEPRELERSKEGELTADEKRALGMAFARLVAEGGDLLLAGSLHDEQGQPRVVTFDPRTGQYPGPSLAHAVAAISRLGGRSGGGTQQQMLAISAAPPDAEAPVEILSPAAPQPVREIRAAHTAPPAGFGPAATREPPARHAHPPATRPRGGCGCGGGGCAGCGGGGKRPRAPLATRTPDGRCEPNPFEISCETQVRLKQCLKQILCEFLRCLDRRLCRDGTFDWHASSHVPLECLGEAICTLLRCVPDALCPPDPPDDERCLPEPRDCLPCNFAVEEPTR
jgi:hypothetical protein